ncbi:hypothetical protein FHR83_008488 [Actinoplanes campanulatus]|uniref:Uncharacterized protein n=1 Tax=Actinoplanes campanulatus TaxID=113559 RepID=A0A7W5FJG6_9ACTN|nr:hypothetical protein [Actinoplanes campanulatus]MBB3100763.1 hypothetical protein [Actinoplanes campanulatus]
MLGHVEPQAVFGLAGGVLEHRSAVATDDHHVPRPRIRRDIARIRQAAQFRVRGDQVLDEASL